MLCTKHQAINMIIWTWLWAGVRYQNLETISCIIKNIDTTILASNIPHKKLSIFFWNRLYNGMITELIKVEFLWNLRNFNIIYQTYPNKFMLKLIWNVGYLTLEETHGRRGIILCVIIACLHLLTSVIEQLRLVQLPGQTVKLLVRQVRSEEVQNTLF